MGCSFGKLRTQTQTQANPIPNYGMPLKRINFTWRSNRALEELRREREMFWETCESYGGRKEIWMALRIVCEGKTEMELETTQCILESAGVILPTGLLTEIYDETGFRYQLPAICICDPIED